jgi:hypothetical protein
MLRRAQLIGVLFAWLLASGGHWHVVQTVAWGRMIAAYAKTMPLPEAVRLTFAPDNLCGVCELVSAAQQTEGANTLPPGVSLQDKLPLVFQPARAVHIFTATVAMTGLPAHRDAPGRVRDAPPLPPPRGAMA